jgi:hypothetical protein
MALGTVSSGTQTCTIDTEHDVASTTTAGIYVCQYNLTNLAKGDVIRCFVTAKVLTGDVEEIVFEGIYANDLGASPIIQSPPVVSMFSLSMMVEQTDGTGRNVPWALVRIAEFS